MASKFPKWQKEKWNEIKVKWRKVEQQKHKVVDTK